VKVPYSWLRELVDVTAPAGDVARTMSVRGFAVEGMETLPDGEVVLDFEVTANRPDCMSIRGIAREVATAYQLPFGPVSDVAPLAPAGDSGSLTVRIDRPDLCSRYVGALATVRIAPSPDWMQARLRACGVRPINNVVDVTNYVLLELGQPMHAFDAALLAHRTIRVRGAAPGEVIRTLDGTERPLTPDVLVIADADRPAAVAGVMGGGDSEVSSATITIIFESASFAALSVRRTSKAMGLKTEASMRFERGVDPELPAVAMARACALLARIGAGRADGTMVDCHPVPAVPRSIPLTRARLSGLLGFMVPDADIRRILSSLGFVLTQADFGWDIQVPTWRVDVSRDVDVIEEVARHHGFDRIPTSFPPLRTPPPANDPRVAQARHVRSVMTGAGFFEAMTFGFIGAAAAARFAGDDDLVTLANPLSETFAVLRPSLVPGLLGSVAHNRRREQPDVRLFEVGARFSRSGGEGRALAFAWTGSADAAHWSKPTTSVGFFDAKGLVDRLGLALRVPVTIEPQDTPWLLRGQSAAVRSGGVTLGVFGRLRPELAEHHGLQADDVVFVGEIDLDAATRLAAPPPRVSPLPRFPSVARDIALLVDDTLAAADLRATILAAGTQALVQVREFDRYQGKGIPEGKVSLALRLTFRAADRTLTDADVQDAMAAVLDAVRARHDAVQR
jgi:phenylalanyl-tRNA synthetase beta chain